MPISPPKSAMVLAAGRGRRMLPLTETQPKPLIEVAGKPLITHVLDRLAGQGIERAVVNVHHFAEQMRAHLAGYDALEVVISDESDQLLDSAGGIQNALPLLGEGPVIAVNSDLILLEDEPSLPRLCGRFNADQMDFLMLLAPTLETTGFDGPGDFHRDLQGALAWRGPGERAQYMNTGTQVIGAEMVTRLKALPSGEPHSILPLWREAVSARRLYGLPLSGRALHVGDPAGREAAEQVLQRDESAA